MDWEKRISGDLLRVMMLRATSARTSVAGARISSSCHQPSSADATRRVSNRPSRLSVAPRPLMGPTLLEYFTPNTVQIYSRQVNAIEHLLGTRVYVCCSLRAKPGVRPGFAFRATRCYLRSSVRMVADPSTRRSLARSTCAWLAAATEPSISLATASAFASAPSKAA